MQVKDKFFIIDFDSTITQVEALDELASIALKNNPGKSEIVDEIKKITSIGMEGKISIRESLARRIGLLKANKSHIAQLIKLLQKKITPSFLRNRHFFQANANNIFIISNGFMEIIVPVVKKFGLPEKNVLANRFVFDGNGNIIGFDEQNILSRENGKAEMLKSLNLKGEIYVMGTATQTTGSRKRDW